MSQYNFFDNPPNLRSQKKTGMAEIFHPVNFQSTNNQYNSQHNNSNRNNSIGRFNEDFEKYPLFDKNLSSKISLIIGRKSAGKTYLSKEIASKLIEQISGSNIITDYTRIILLTSHQSDEYEDIEYLIDREKTNYEVLSYFGKLTDKIKDENEDFSNSLVIIEDDINLDEKNKEVSELKEFFDYTRHKQMTIIIIRNNISSLPTLISSVVDYLFIFCGAIYSDLQKIHSRFLPEIGFGNFYRIYREMMGDSNAVCAINLVIPPRSNKKENKRKWNLLDSFYRYYLNEESGDEKDIEEQEEEQTLSELPLHKYEGLNPTNLSPQKSYNQNSLRRKSIGTKRSWRTNQKNDEHQNDDEGQGYTHFQPINIDDDSHYDNLGGRVSRIGSGTNSKNTSPSSKKKEEIKDQVRIKLNQINELINDIKNLIRI